MKVKPVKLTRPVVDYYFNQFECGVTGKEPHLTRPSYEIITNLCKS
jgi:hypothetical protein